MQMKYGLSRIRPAIHDDSESPLRKTIVTRQFNRNSMNFADQRSVLGRNVQHGRNVFSRHDQKMHRRLWTDVLEGND